MHVDRWDQCSAQMERKLSADWLRDKEGEGLPLASGARDEGMYRHGGSTVTVTVRKSEKEKSSR